MRYNAETLHEYCKENEIVLVNDYTKEHINRETYLEGKCKNNDCNKNFYKDFRQLVKTGAYCLDCLKLFHINKLKTNTSEKYNQIFNTFCEENKVELLEDYSTILMNRDSIIKGNCKTDNCDNIFEKTLRELLKHKDYCFECCKEHGKEKGKNTFIKNYGYEHPMKNKEYQEKTKNTIIEKYGVTHISKLDRIKQQKKEKSLNKYGVEYPLQCPEIRSQIVKTNIEKYGCENPMQNEEIRNKMQKTVQQRMVLIMQVNIKQ
jgi:hypothetical protein